VEARKDAQVVQIEKNTQYDQDEDYPPVGGTLICHGLDQVTLCWSLACHWYQKFDYHLPVPSAPLRGKEEIAVSVGLGGSVGAVIDLNAAICIF